MEQANDKVRLFGKVSGMRFHGLYEISTAHARFSVRFCIFPESSSWRVIVRGTWHDLCYVSAYVQANHTPHSRNHRRLPAPVWPSVHRRGMAGVRTVHVSWLARLAHRHGGSQVSIERLISGSYVLRCDGAEYLIRGRKAYTSAGEPVSGELLARLLRAFDSLLG